MNRGNTAQPFFDVPVPREVRTYALTVSDGLLEATDEVVVTVRNNAPVADAGADQEVDGGDEVHLDAHVWRQTQGDEVRLSDPTNVRPRFKAPDREVDLRFELVVNDGIVDSEPDDVRIRVRD